MIIPLSKRVVLTVNPRARWMHPIIRYTSNLVECTGAKYPPPVSKLSDIVQKLGNRVNSGNKQMIPGAGAGDL
jgi:hypothetical protein